MLLICYFDDCALGAVSMTGDKPIIQPAAFEVRKLFSGRQRAVFRWQRAIAGFLYCRVKLEKNE